MRFSSIPPSTGSPYVNAFHEGEETAQEVASHRRLRPSTTCHGELFARSLASVRSDPKLGPSREPYAEDAGGHEACRWHFCSSASFSPRLFQRAICAPGEVSALSPIV